MKAHASQTGLCHPGLRLVGLLLCFGCGTLSGQPAWAQDPTPPTAPEKAATPSLGDQFSADLEILSKRLRVAFVAEGEPFPQKEYPNPPTLNEALTPDDAVKEVADYFDYAAVRQGKVYLLTKRYTNPEDLPDITPEECHNAIRLLMSAVPGRREPVSPLPTLEGDFVFYCVNPQLRAITNAQWDRLRAGGMPAGELADSIGTAVWQLSYKHYFMTHHDLIEGTMIDLENRAPLNPYFHWKTAGKSRIFGYDMFMVDFIPMGDSRRVVVTPRKDPIVKPGFLIRNDVLFPEKDLSDPAALSEQTRRFLDSQAKASHAVSLKQATAAINKQASKAEAYGVEDAYAPKQVTLAGMDNLAPMEAMQALAAVYGLRLAQRENGKIIVADPTSILDPLRFYDRYVTPSGSNPARTIFRVLPPPIYRAIRARLAPGHSSPLDTVAIGAPNDPGPALTLEQFDEAGAKFQNVAVQEFRYLAEAQVLPGTQRTLSLLGQHARNLFSLIRTAPAFADACALIDCPLPPYITPNKADFYAHATLKGAFSDAPGADSRLQFSLNYSNPDTGDSFGPVFWFDVPIPAADLYFVPRNRVAIPQRVAPYPY